MQLYSPPLCFFVGVNMSCMKVFKLLKISCCKVKISRKTNTKIRMVFFRLAPRLFKIQKTYGSFADVFELGQC